MKMIKNPRYDVTIFQRKPGLWRASILSKDRRFDPLQPMQSFLTPEDSASEIDAEQAALKAIMAFEDS